MAVRAPGPATGGFRFRPLGKPEEYRAAEEVQRVALGMEGELPASATVLRGFADHGGLVLGAFADIYLAGVAVGYLGWDGTELYHFNHLIVVRPEYQNHHVAFQLSAYLREEVLRQGLPRVRGTFDPLQSRAARLVVRRLGAAPDKYLTHYFGRLDAEADRGLETDRVRFLWELTAPKTMARLGGELPNAEADLAAWNAAGAIVETEQSEQGLRRPTAVAEPDRPSAHLEVPFDLAAVREHAPESLRPWRHAVRDAFRAAHDLGYAVQDFLVLNLEHERRSFYLLAPAPKPSPAPAASDPPSPVGPNARATLHM